MQKIVTTIVALAVTLVSMATDYTDKMSIKVSGNVTNQEATISVDEEEDGTYTFELKNFIMEQAGVTMAIGNVTLNNVPQTIDSDGTINLEANEQTATITAGDDPSVTFWMGPLLGSLPVTLKAKIANGELYAQISISVSGSDVNVVFGTDYKTYTGSMSITVGESEPTTQDATIYVGEQADSAYAFLLKNFVFTLDGSSMGIGNIKLSDAPATTNEDGTISIHAEQTIKITSGDDPTIFIWMGPLLGDVAVTMDGKISGDDLEATITIPYLTNDITVTFSTGESSAIKGITSTSSSVETIYDASGRKVSSPTKGLNIIRKTDGTTIKVLNK